MVMAVDTSIGSILGQRLHSTSAQLGFNVVTYNSVLSALETAKAFPSTNDLERQTVFAAGGDSSSGKGVSRTITLDAYDSQCSALFSAKMICRKMLLDTG